MCDNGKTAADITVTSAVIRRCSSSMQLIDGGLAWRGISGKSFLPKYEFLRDRKPKYFEEYRDVLFRAPGIRPSKVISATGDWRLAIVTTGDRISRQPTDPCGNRCT